MGDPAGAHWYTLMVEVPPPPLNAETIRMSPGVCTPLKPPLEGPPEIPTFCWKNQIPMLESPFPAKRSAPNTRTLSPSALATYAAPSPWVRVSLSGVEVSDHSQ